MTQTSAEQLLDAITTREFSALEAALEPGILLRALLPSGLVEVAGPADIAGKFAEWFGAAEKFEVVEARTQVTGDRQSFRYRLRVRRPGEDETEISQHVILIEADGALEAMHLMCTGFRPVRVLAASGP